MLHHRIAPEQVVMWVPFAIEHVKAALPKRLNYPIGGRRGEKRKIIDVPEWHGDDGEQEVTADLAGVRPVGVLGFETRMRGVGRLHGFRSFMGGKTDLAAVARAERVTIFDEGELRRMEAEFAAFRDGRASR